MLPSRKNRKSIINNKEIDDVVYSLFPDLKDYNYKDYFPLWPLEYKETEKFSIFVTGKGGSTITNRILSANKLSVIKLEDQDSINENMLYHNNLMFGLDSSKELHKELHELIKILEGKSTKDLIFVIRNPILKWMSGVSQEIDEELKNSLSAVSFLYEKYGLKLENNLDLFSSYDKNKTIIEEVFCDLAYKILEGSFGRYGTSQHNHVQLYNEIIYLIMQNNPNMDLSKVYFIDLDSDGGDLVELFKKYYPTIDTRDVDGFWTQREKYKIIFSRLKNYIMNNNRIMYQVIQKELQRDLKYYHLLHTKYSKNIIK